MSLLYFISCILLLSSTPPRSIPEEGRSFPTIRDLDRMVDKSEDYERRRLAGLDSLRALLRVKSDEESLYIIYSDFCSIYDRYQTDSALIYAKKAVRMASRLKDNEMNRSRMTRALTMLGKQFETAGMHNEALETLGQIDRHTATAEEMTSAYNFYIFVYESLKSQCLDPDAIPQYDRQIENYKDSVLRVSPGRVVTLSEKRLDTGDCLGALELLLPLYDTTDISSARMGSIALLAADIHFRMGLKQEARNYLIVSAISDILNGKKEYIALRRLGIELYKEGDITRAYKYLSKSLKDATFCNARIKIDEIVPMLSIVEDAYSEQKEMVWNIVVLSLVVVCLLVLALMVLIRRERKEKQTYAELSRKLKQARELQEETTAQVREASNIKDSYITGLMLECIYRIERLDNYRQDLNRMALAGELRGLQKELKSKAVVEQEWDSFYNVFDKTFLSLFPDFIRDFNRLMKEPGKITNCTRGSLTQELRTFALVRLGINSSEKIATLLRYSRSTIYNYRSKARTNAVNPATFEEDLMKIQSI